MLRREGWQINDKRVHRLNRQDGLQLRMRMRRRMHMCLHRGVVSRAYKPGERLSMDFVHDLPIDGRPFPILPVVNKRCREAVIVEPSFRFSGQAVVDVLDR